VDYNKKIHIRPEQIEEAKRLYDFKNLKNSITNGKSQLHGALGELLAMEVLDLRDNHVEYVGHFDYDLICNGKRIDVKTIQTDKEPNDDFNANISAFNHTQQTDYYLWCSVSVDMTYGYVIGYLDKDEFYKIAELKKKGEIDCGKWVFKSDTYTTKIKNIKKFN
jgi:hypothetical protein